MIALYILQYSLHNDIFNYICSCETANELWEIFLLLYKDKNEENVDNILNNFYDNKDVNHVCQMINEQASDPNWTVDDDDGNIKWRQRKRVWSSDWGTWWVKQVPKIQVIKFLLYFLKQLQRYCSKIKRLNKMIFNLSQENVELRKLNSWLSNDINVGCPS